MEINRKNYESYFIDYLDGNLSSVQEEELRAFLLVNNDLSELLEDIEQIRLKKPNIKFQHKSDLKKTECQSCPDYYSIAIAENCLSQPEQELVAKYPFYQETAEIYKKLKLSPSPAVVYAQKAKLYHSNYQHILYYVTSVAALFLLLLGTIYFFHSKPIQDIPLLNAQTLILPECPAIEAIEIMPSSKPNTHPVNIEKSFPNEEKNRIAILSPLKSQKSPQLIPPTIDYSIKYIPLRTAVSQTEIHLAEAAITWKSSEKQIFSDNIFKTMIYTGKIIASKIKTKEYSE